jgi:hypothetical protein
MKINPFLYVNLNFIPRFLIGIIMIMFSVLLQLGYSQDLVLEDMTISTTEFYAAENSITVGPQFTVAGTGEVTFKSGNYITIKPGFVVIAGGKVSALAGVSTDIEMKFNPEIPKKFDLMQNYPNPFNPTTTIAYQLTKSGHVQLTIYDLLGKEIQTLVNKVQNQGKYQILFDAGNLVSGVYLYRLQIEGAVVTKKMIVMK